MKLNISDPKTSKTYSVEADDKTKLSFIGKKIKDEVELSFIDASLKGVITGGSNKDGFPMMSSLDVEGTKKVLIPDGFAFKAKRDGERKRKRVAGKMVNEKTQQINIKLTQGDSKILDEKFAKKEESEKKE